MNLLYFCAGTGLGALIGVVTTLLTIGRIGKAALADSKSANTATQQLMADRNELDRKKVDALWALVSK